MFQARITDGPLKGDHSNLLGFATCQDLPRMLKQLARLLEMLPPDVEFLHSLQIHIEGDGETVGEIEIPQ